MRSSRNIAAAAAACVLLIAGCSAAPDSNASTNADGGLVAQWNGYVDPNDPARVDPVPPLSEWEIDVEDPRVVAGISSSVILGTVTGVNGATVDLNGDIETQYQVTVDRAYKGDLKEGDSIEVTLPGGTLPLGEYISRLDEFGIYDDIFPEKSDEFAKEKGIEINPSATGPRGADPNMKWTINWGCNPTSASLIESLDPDAWVFFLDEEEDGTYRGAALQHSLMYLKDGYVFSLFPEPPEGRIPPVSEAELAT